MKFLRFLAILPACGWFVWSFILADRALYYSQFPLIVSFQNWLWQYSENRPLITGIYLLLLLSLFCLYFGSMFFISEMKVTLKRSLVAISVLSLFFVFSNPALSYDLFNYMFDAKLVVHYHLDPHTTSAISFDGKDEWVRFMRNTFFPTTYGYAWTALSLIPYVLGMGKWILVFSFFKLYMFLSAVVLFALQWLISKKILGKDKKSTLISLSLFFLSPLVFIEVFSSGHNDLWMMSFAFASLVIPLWMARKGEKARMTVELISKIALSFALLYISSQVKRSTALLLPVWLLLVADVVLPSGLKRIKRMVSFLMPWWADISTVLLFLPLLTPLSRQFHPWYLLWSFSFVPFVRSRILRIVIVCFSLTSTLRYLPVLYFGLYSKEIESVQRTITWSALPLACIIIYGFWLYKRVARKVR